MIRSVTTSSGVARTRRARAARDEHWPRRCEAASRRLGRSVLRVAPNQTPRLLPSSPPLPSSGGQLVVVPERPRRGRKPNPTSQRRRGRGGLGSKSGWRGRRASRAPDPRLRRPPPPVHDSAAREAAGRSLSRQRISRRSAAAPLAPVPLSIVCLVDWAGVGTPFRNAPSWIGLDWIGLDATNFILSLD